MEIKFIWNGLAFISNSLTAYNNQYKSGLGNGAKGA